MPVRNTDYDIIIQNSSLTPIARKLRLVVQRDSNGNGHKLWSVGEATPDSIRADFGQRNWAWGPGLETLDFNSEQAGLILRYYDGYGIDTTEGKVKQGPGASEVGSVTGTVKRILLGPDDRVWIVTSSHLYAWNGTTLENFWGDAGSTHGASGVTSLVEATVFGNSLVVAAGSDGYYHTDGSASPTNETENADLLLELNGVLWVVNDTNEIHAIADPLGTPTIGAAIDIGSGKAITNLFALSGILFVATESSLFTVASDNTVTELSQKLRQRAGAGAFSVKAADGDQAWLSDSSGEMLRIAALGFDEFDVTWPGPFARTQEELPFTHIDSAGTITGADMDSDFVYLAVDRGGDLYVYKGAEVLRGRYVWSPLIRRESASNITLGVAKMTGDDNPIIYVDDGGTIYEYDSRDWTTWNTDAQLVTSYFVHDDESQVKLWTRLKVLFEGDGTTGNGCTIQPSQRSGTITSYTNIGSAVGAGAQNLNPGLISNPRVQLRFTWSSSDSTKHIDIKAFTLEGLVRPEVRQIWDFTVRVPNADVASWLRSLRTQGSSLTLVTDPLGTQHDTYVLPGYPRETILEDTILQKEVMSFQIITQEVPS